MKFTKLSETAFKELQLNAGILLNQFDPVSGSVDLEEIVGATSGGVNFTAVPTFSDFGEDVDNCPVNTKELKKLDSMEVRMSGRFISVTAASVKQMLAAADISGDKITPRRDLKADDFRDLWWVGDYSDKNGESAGGFIAVHMMNTLSTGGLSIQSNKSDKGRFAFEFMAHYSMADPDTVPFEVYVKAGAEEV